MPHPSHASSGASRRRFATPIACAAIAIAVGACEHPPTEPVATPFTPPTEYEAWWTRIEQCSGRTAPFDRVRWLEVRSRTTVHGRDVGEWWAPHDIILPLFYVDSPHVVQHEMLHDLLQEPGHPIEFDRCGVR